MINLEFWNHFYLAFAKARMDNSGNQFIITADGRRGQTLPPGTYMELSNDMGYMRLRKNPSVLRMHKYGRDDAHKQIYSELLFYRPFRNEDDLPKNNLDRCLELYSEMDPGEARRPAELQKSNIHKVKELLFPSKKKVEEARDLLQELTSSRPQHLLDQLDPEAEMERDELSAEGMFDAEEFAARDPGVMPADDSSPSPATKQMYRRIDITDKSAMRRSARQLDAEQRLAFDELIKYFKRTRQSRANPEIPLPKPPLLKIHGGAGTGKSKLIKDISTWAEFWLRVDNNRDPSHPYVIKCAPTGRAAKVIAGLTIHTAFGFYFGNTHMSMGDKIRDSRRTQLSDLRVVIIDEMSMVKADMLYQLNLRFQEITLSVEDFGGVSVILCGDLMQLKPVCARWIFEEPAGKEYKAFHASNPLWELFEPVELIQNHRQGEDRVYADLLNRMRVGENTEEDFQLLKSRVTSEIPPNAWHFYGFNKLVYARNKEELNKLNTPLFSFASRHTHPNMVFKSEFGKVNETSFDYDLELKLDSRVMVVHNIDAGDGLINGTTGHVRGFIRSDGSQAKDSSEVHMILAEFDDEEDGQDLRKANNHILRRCSY